MKIISFHKNINKSMFLIRFLFGTTIFCLVNASHDNYREELVNALTKYVETHHNGDFLVAFKYFDKNKDNHIDRLELNLALKNWSRKYVYKNSLGKWYYESYGYKPEDDVLSFDELVVASFDQAIHTNENLTKYITLELCRL